MGRTRLPLMRGAIGVILILLCQETIAANTKKYKLSVPAHLYLAELNKRRVLPSLRAKFKDGGWRLVDTTNAHSGCSLSLQGVLTVTNRDSEEIIERCELVLFNPKFQLAKGWELVRIHWGGDTRSVRWITNPFHTNMPHLHLELAAPVKGKRSVIMRLLTLTGPVGSSWEQSFTRH